MWLIEIYIPYTTGKNLKKKKPVDLPVGEIFFFFKRIYIEGVSLFETIKRRIDDV